MRRQKKYSCHALTSPFVVCVARCKPLNLYTSDCEGLDQVAKAKFQEMVERVEVLSVLYNKFMFDATLDPTSWHQVT